MVRFATALLLLGLALPALAEFTASVDRRVIDENDVVVLELRRDAQVFVGNPDLTALEDDFTVLGTQRASQFTISGGRTRSVTTWTVTLQPKRRGTLRIPPIEYDGERTAPITVTVTQPSAEEVAALERTVFFETEVSKPEIWVQEQLLYTVRLYYAADAVLFGDLPPPPTIENTVVQALGDSRPGVEVRDGIRYNVIEQRYALVPQRSGVLVIPPESFAGAVRIAERGATRRKNIRVASDGHRVDVAPQPDQWPAGVPWLPARDLRLAERWDPSPPVLRAGEPVTRTLEIVARGIAASTLPEIRPPELAGARAYGNQPQLDEGLTNGDVVASRIESTVLIPESSGTLELPEVRIPWFDVGSGEIRMAVVPARRLEVAAGEAPARAPAPAPLEPPRTERAEPPAPAPAPGVEDPPLRREIGAFDVDLPWRAIAIVLAVLWLLTLALWWRMPRPSGPRSTRSGPAGDPRASQDAWRRALLDACRAHDAAAARRAAEPWRRATRLDPELKAELNDSLRALDGALFAPERAAWDGTALAKLVERADRRRTGPESPSDAQALPPLHPRGASVDT